MLLHLRVIVMGETRRRVKDHPNIMSDLMMGRSNGLLGNFEVSLVIVSSLLSYVAKAFKAFVKPL